MSVDDICALSLSAVSHLIKHRKISPVAVTEATLDRISRIDPHINSFITVTGQEASPRQTRQRPKLRWVGIAAHSMASRFRSRISF